MPVRRSHYLNIFYVGSSNIPSGSVSLSDGLNIISTVVANSSAMYMFTGWVEPITQVRHLMFANDFDAFM